MKTVTLAACLTLTNLTPVLTSATAQADATFDPYGFLPPLLLDQSPVPAICPTVLTLNYLNDGDSVRPGGTDRHYTAAVEVSLASQISWARDFGRILPSFCDQFNPALPNTTYALGLTAGLDFYTPQDISAPIPDPTDHPYAGWLYGGLYFQRARAEILSPTFGNYAVFEHLQLDLGITGSASQAGRTQKFVHKVFGYDQPEGWPHEIHDEFGFDVTYQRKYRFTLFSGADCGLPKEFALDLIPQAGFTLGTIDRFFDAAATLRAGWQLPDDFGPALIHEPPAATGNAQHPMFGIYAFVRGYGKLVWYNTTLEGNNFRDSPGVDAFPAVAEFTPGVSVQFLRHVELTYSQTFLTKEFVGQPTADAYGLVTISLFWSF